MKRFIEALAVGIVTVLSHISRVLNARINVHGHFLIGDLIHNILYSILNVIVCNRYIMLLLNSVVKRKFVDSYM